MIFRCCILCGAIAFWRGVALGAGGPAEAVAVPSPSGASLPATSTLVAVPLVPPALARGSAEQYLEIAELLRVFGDAERSRRFAGYALGQGLTRDALAQSFYQRRFSLVEFASRPGALDSREIIRKDGRIYVPAERWVVIIMDKMEKVGLGDEATEFGVKCRYVNPESVDKRLSEMGKLQE